MYNLIKLYINIPPNSLYINNKKKLKTVRFFSLYSTLLDLLLLAKLVALILCLVGKKESKKKRKIKRKKKAIYFFI